MRRTSLSPVVKMIVVVTVKNVWQVMKSEHKTIFFKT